MTKSITYVGPYPEVVIHVDDDLEAFVVVHPGDTFEASDDRAAALIEQGAAEPARASKSAKKES